MLKKKLTLNLYDLGFNSRESIVPGDIVRLGLSSNKSLASTYTHFLHRLLRQLHKIENGYCVDYINLFGILNDEELKSFARLTVHNCYEPNDVIRYDFSVTSGNIVVIDCVDALSWLCITEEDFSDYERLWKEQLLRWKSEGKIVFVGTTGSCKWNLGNIVNLYI